MRIRYIAGWLAKVADLAGMKKLAAGIRAMTYNEAERFVMSAIDRSGEPVNGLGGDAVRRVEGADVPRFKSSSTAGVAARMGDAIKSVNVQNIKDQASYKKSDWLGLGLQALGRRQIVDIYGKDLPQLGSYNKLAAQMEADKNEVGAEADHLAQRWGNLKDEKALAELMHDATLAQIDPDKEHVIGDNKLQHSALSARFNRLSDAAKQVFREARRALTGLLVMHGLGAGTLGLPLVAAALGPVAGIGVNILKGVQDMSKGQFGRGLEGMLPAAVRNGVKAIRYANEGARDKSGIVIKDEVSPAEVAGQALGFSPSRVRNASEGKSAVLDLDRELGRRRSHLLNEYANARRDGDAEAVNEAQQAIAKFNEKNPGRRINVPQMMASVRARQRRIDQANDGIYLPKSHRDAREAGRFALEN